MEYLAAAVVIPLATLAVWLGLWWWLGRDPSLPPLVTEHTPPPGMNPAQAVILLAQGNAIFLSGPRALSRVIGSTLLDLYRRQILTLHLSAQGKYRLLDRVQILDRSQLCGSFEQEFIRLLSGDKDSADARVFNNRHFRQGLRDLLRREANLARPLLLTPASHTLSRIAGTVFSALEKAVGLVLTLAVNLSVVFIYLWIVPLGVVLLSMWLADSLLSREIINLTQRENILMITGLTGAFSPFILLFLFSVKKTPHRGLVRVLFILYRTTLYLLSYSVTFLAYLSWPLLLYFVLSRVFHFPEPVLFAVLLSLVISRLFSLWMPRWNARSRIQLHRLLGYREYLRRVDADAIQRLSLDYPRDYQDGLAFALALGYGRCWMRALQKWGTVNETYLLLYHFSLFFESVALNAGSLTRDYGASSGE